MANSENDKPKANPNLKPASPADIFDGRLQVAQAIEATSDLVSVNVSAGTVDPPKLFNLSFNDPQVGINDVEAMRLFKANLEALLPIIALQIDNKISTEPSQNIGAVANIVELLLEA